MKLFNGILPAVILLVTGGLALGQVENPNYDKDLAERLGADDYGMKTYVFVILETNLIKPFNGLSITYTTRWCKIPGTPGRDDLVRSDP